MGVCQFLCIFSVLDSPSFLRYTEGSMQKTLEQQTVSAPSRYHVITFGCQMNKNDSERLSGLLAGIGLVETDTPETADILILNSCAIRKSAEDRVMGLVHKFGEWKKERPELLICVTGCMPGRDRDGALKRSMPAVDYFFPTKDMRQLPKWIAEVRPEVLSMVDQESDYLAITPIPTQKFRAFLTIQTGCNHFCTYCVVPFSRGLEVNRPLVDILREARLRATEGCVELTLLGQIVNHYRAPDPEVFSSRNPYRTNDFAKLLWELNQIEGIARIHFTAPHPIYMDDEVIDALTLPKQVNFLHLPVQSGNSEILKKMNRRHDRQFFLSLVEKIRNKLPAIALGTDIIVGFSGETEERFLDTVSLYEACQFDISYTAQYSERTHTVAHKAFVDDVPREEKKRRWEVLQSLMEEIAYTKNQHYVDTVVSVLADGYEGGFSLGTTRELKRIKWKTDAPMIGQMTQIEVYKAQEWMLYGRTISKDSPKI